MGEIKSGGAPNAARRLNAAGLELLKKHEGLRLVAYRCIGGRWTIGYGHTRTVREGMRITLAQALLFLQEDVRIAERAVAELVTVPLSFNQFSALVCFVFNVGRSKFEGSSLLMLLNRGWYDQVPAQLLRWHRVFGEAVGGLSRRRRAEVDLWNREDDAQSAVLPSYTTPMEMADEA